ncbi:putative flippase GtrA [Kribbella jejuensis]|uniref:Putative flippase GtrA n=1 Tax=Kribbella jejuensis TaxID=236068 RepID=A0A542E8F4_9ACTN|nr:putative flippase GtrA [Kribbella jejuensis]
MAPQAARSDTLRRAVDFGTGPFAGYRGKLPSPSRCDHRRFRTPLKLVTTLYHQFQHLVHEVAKFGLVGVLGLVVDLPIYNWLVFNNPLVLGDSGIGVMHHKPLTAKLISTTIATIVTYFGNRYWTWRHRERSGLHREYVLFFVLNGIGLLIAAGCLAFSRYVLDLHTWLSDNIAANFIGLGLGTLFRFWSYRKFVFKEEIALDEAEHVPAPDSPAALDGESTGDLPVVR